MVRPAHLYYTDGTMKDVVPSNGKYFTLKELQDMVGGYIEFIHLPESKCMVVNEEGKIMGLELNQYATYIYQHYFPTTEDMIVGNAIVADWEFFKKQEEEGGYW